MIKKLGFILLMAMGLLAPIYPCEALSGETLSLDGANWAGDANMTGGLDAGMAGDADALVASGSGYSSYPTTYDFAITLAEEYSRSPYVEFTIGFRLNSMQTSIGIVKWDGVPLCVCHANDAVEQLGAKRVRVATSEFDVSAGGHVLTVEAVDTPENTYDFFEVDAVQVLRVGPALPAAPVPAATWLIVRGGDESEAELLNIEKLQEEMTGLLGSSPEVVSAGELSDVQKTSNSLVLVGTYGRNALSKALLDAEGHPAPFASDAAFVQEQGYIAGAYPSYYAPRQKVILATGWDTLGSVFAISHLRTNLQNSGDGLYLAAEGNASNLTSVYNEYRPDVARRGVYYNIAYGISFGKLTPDNWNASDWEYWVDQLVAAQLTHVEFYIWGNAELDYPYSTVNATRNHTMRLALQHMITYAHSRGMKVVYHFSPGIIPSDIYGANKSVGNFAGTSDYATAGYPCPCPADTSLLSYKGHTWNNAMDLITDIFRTQIEYFAEADEFRMWFYDPGGCWCSDAKNGCKSHQVERLMTHVQTFFPIVQANNPDARFSVSTWPIWLLENGAYIGYAYGNTFLTQLKTYAQSQDALDRFDVADTLASESSFVPEGISKGFGGEGFLFETNIETAYPFLNPLLAFTNGLIDRGVGWGCSEMHFHRNEEGSKYPMSFFLGQRMWDHERSDSDVTMAYARWIANTNPTSAQELQQAFVLMDSFHYDGSSSQDMTAKGAQIRDLVVSAVGRLSAERQAKLEFLTTTAKVLALYGEAAENPGNSTLLDTLFASYRTVLGESAAFAPFYPYASRARFDQHVSWLRAGWRSAGF